MGLDFSHTEARWAYHGFHIFRTRLAKEIGINLNEMDGFNKENNYKGIPWKYIKDPIKYLLDHSDCEGYITPIRCKKVAPRLRELVASWDNDDYDKIHALLLADGMEKAAAANELLRFK